MTAPLGVGLIGCGRIARMFHLPVLRDLPSARLVGIADTDEDARSAAARLVPGATAVPDIRALLALPDVDAVVVCLPTHLHGDAAVAAFAAGRHVYVEKPLAADSAEGQRIRAAWLASGRIGAVGFNFRFHPLYQRARGLIAAGRLGEVVAVRTAFSSAPRELPEWKRSRRTGGGALLDLASHHVDLVRYLLAAEVDAVSATIRSRLSSDDTAAVTLALSTGATAQLLATVSAAQSDRVEVLGSAATLHADRMASRRLDVVPAQPPASRSQRLAAAGRILRDSAVSTRDRLRPPAEPSFALALRDFVRSARTGTPAGATIDDGLRSLTVIEAAERSAATGAEVTLSVASPG